MQCLARDPRQAPERFLAPISSICTTAAYFTAQTHDMRASLWTPGSLILIFMTCRTLLAALSY